jgi:CRP/FNR family transcriptional regulator, cyclic AMP receptor protein
MSTILHSEAKRENTGRTIRAQGFFAGLPDAIQKQLTNSARVKKFSDRQIIQHRGDDSQGFWIISKGQVKLGQYNDDGDMRVLVILGANDSFGELACLGGYPRVLDAESVGKSELLWITESKFSETIIASPSLNREVLGALSRQLQEALDYIAVHRKMPAGTRLVRTLLILCEGRKAPITLGIRQQEMAELVGVSRVSIAKTLAELENDGLVQRGYGELIVNDAAALKAWMIKRA